MTEKNIFGNFFVVKYFRFLFTFYVKTATSPEKSHPLFPSNLPLKIGILSSPLYWTFDQSLNTPSRKGGGGEGIILEDIHLNWLNWFHILILEGGLFTILIVCMIFLSSFLDVTRMFMSAVSFLVQPDYRVLSFELWSKWL